MRHTLIRKIALAPALALAAAGCTAQEEVATQLPSMTPVEYVGLPGSSWQMVEFRSNDDSQRPVRPVNAAEFTLDFNADGTLSMGIGCNRGNGPWTASQGGRATSGQISIGPLATTRMACPNPAVADRLERDLPNIRGYLVRDNMLYLNLMADAGTWVYAPRVR